MSQDHQPILKALNLIKTGDKAWEAGDHHRALSCYEDAKSLAQQVPAGEWDQKAFLAVCAACLSGPLAALGRTNDALEQANQALAFFDRVGEMYPAEFFRWITATFNKGASLAQLGQSQEALVYIRKARSMLPAGTEYEQFRALCDHNIIAIESTLNSTHERDKPWWKFW